LHYQYELLVDKHAGTKGVPSEFTPKSFFGQLKNILVVTLSASKPLKLSAPTTLILAVIHSCNVDAHDDLDIHYYKNLGRTEVVDMTAVQCVVGRVKVGGRWAILDRSGSMARAYYDPDEEDHNDGQQAQDGGEND
jgi:hypothetical protein